MSESQSTDEYTRKYMEGGAAVVSDRKGIPRWMHALLLLPVVALTGTVIATGAWVLLAMLPVLLSIWLLFAFLRMTLTPTHMHIQYGLFGPKIPIEDIVSVRSTQYDWKEYGGWGLRYGRNGGVAYSVPGGSGECVEIEYRKSNGKTARVAVTTDKAAEFVTAILRLKSATGVRVETATSAPVEQPDAEGMEIEQSRGQQARR